MRTTDRPGYFCGGRQTDRATPTFLRNKRGYIILFINYLDPNIFYIANIVPSTRIIIFLKYPHYPKPQIRKPTFPPYDSFRTQESPIVLIKNQLRPTHFKISK